MLICLNLYFIPFPQAVSEGVADFLSKTLERIETNFLGYPSYFQLIATFIELSRNNTGSCSSS